ncbi:antiterminator Q family protein [Pseudomonas sp. A-RE-23]|uniref:antiterminator Q family protein n=1 Tax=Pseudomonas sp. A-RE-23 TaxID=2832376 RepID=UPI001CC1763B|nr:antiterminator Q family protein [Pseudomonas sp. A-RE-23]
MTYDAEELLTQWGRWVWQGAGVPGYGISPLYALMRDNVEQVTRSLPAAISDDEALMVDRAVASLWKRYPKTADCVRFYYCTGMTMQSVGNGLGLSRLKVRELIIAGNNYIQACLDMRAAA